MKLHKIISRTVVATALLGATFGGAFSGINVNANDANTTQSAEQVSGSDGTGGSNKTDTSKIVRKNFGGLRESEIGANVPDGFLTLDSVPNLGFGNNRVSSEGQSATLPLNDGNNGVLQITDNRNVDKYSNSKSSSSSNQGNSGWTLKAYIDPFQKNGGPSNSNGDKWQITFNDSVSNDSLSDNGKNPTMNSLDGSNALTTNTNSSQQSNIISASDGTAGYGTNTVNFNNNDQASLYIPNVKNGSYTTTMHWSLVTDLSSYNTDYNH